jgi:hypothetical protein
MFPFPFDPSEIFQLSDLGASSDSNDVLDSIENGICRRQSSLFAKSVGSLLHVMPAKRPFLPVCAQHHPELPL